jgi:hypothetical protein
MMLCMFVRLETLFESLMMFLKNKIKKILQIVYLIFFSHHCLSNRIVDQLYPLPPNIKPHTTNYWHPFHLYVFVNVIDNNCVCVCVCDIPKSTFFTKCNKLNLENA